MKKSSLSLWLSSFLIIIIPHVRAVSRLRLNALRVGLAPASRGLTNNESYLLRDTVQYILEDLLLRNSPNRRTPSDWPDIASIGLERILENSVSSDGIIRLRVDGLVYFSFSANAAPTNEEFSTYLEEELLTPSVLLEAITSTSIDGVSPFQNFTRVALWEDFYDVPSGAPTTLPTLSLSTLQPTVAPTTSRKVSNPTGHLNDYAFDGNNKLNNDDDIITGVAIAGGILLFLTLVVCICNRRTKPLDIVSEGQNSTALEPSEAIKISTDKTASDEESNLQKSKEGDARSGQNMFGTVVDTTQDMDDMSDESFGDATFDDDLGFTGAAKIQPDIVMPKRQDSFGHRVYSIQKDMLESSAVSKATTAKQPKSLMGLPPKPAQDDHCILEPTDLSAASLADAGFYRQPSRLSDSGRRSLVPKPIENMWGQERKTKDLLNFDGESEYSGWDPDDASTIESEDIFLTSNIPNPAEQSLLHHSVRFESYKMQRLRTPENKKKMTLS